MDRTTIADVAVYTGILQVTARSQSRGTPAI